MNETYSSAKKFLVALNEYIKYKSYFIVISTLYTNIKNIKNKVVVKYNKKNKSRSISTRKRLNANLKKINYFFLVFDRLIDDNK